MDLPADLRTALDGALAQIAPQRLAQATAALVERYRSNRPAPDGQFLTSDDEIAAYAAYRLPATYAAVAAALAQIAAQWPDEPPRSLLDVGAGPGTALWAAQAVWPDLERALLLERDARMLALGQRLALDARAPAIRAAVWRQADLLGAWDAPAHDLVVAAYVLNELPAARRAGVIDALWQRSSGALVLLEPGTPAGFARIREARQHLLAQGATILAPCPHDDACPIPADDWCHFGQRLNRTRLHRQTKGATLSYEDEKYSYVAAAHHPAPAIAGRIIRRPQILPGRVVLELCTPTGLRTANLTRAKDRAAFRAARDLHWGDALLDEEES